MGRAMPRLLFHGRPAPVQRFVRHANGDRAEIEAGQPFRGWVGAGRGPSAPAPDAGAPAAAATLLAIVFQEKLRIC